MEDDFIDSYQWLTDEFIIELLNTQYTLKVTKTLSIDDGEVLSIADINKYVDYNADKYDNSDYTPDFVPRIKQNFYRYMLRGIRINIILKWRISEELALDPNYIDNIFENPDIKSLTLYDINGQHVTIDTDLDISRCRHFKFSNITQFRVCLMFNQNMIMGG